MVSFGKYPDITFRCEDENFSVHKHIISHYSYFEKLIEFEGNKAEHHLPFSKNAAFWIFDWIYDQELIKYQSQNVEIELWEDFCSVWEFICSDDEINPDPKFFTFYCDKFVTFIINDDRLLDICEKYPIFDLSSITNFEREILKNKIEYIPFNGTFRNLYAEGYTLDKNSNLSKYIRDKWISHNLQDYILAISHYSHIWNGMEDSYSQKLSSRNFIKILKSFSRELPNPDFVKMVPEGIIRANLELLTYYGRLGGECIKNEGIVCFGVIMALIQYIPLSKIDAFITKMLDFHCKKQKFSLGGIPYTKATQILSEGKYFSVKLDQETAVWLERMNERYNATKTDYWENMSSLTLSQINFNKNSVLPILWK